MNPFVARASATLLLILTACAQPQTITPQAGDTASLAPQEQRGEQCEEGKEVWRTQGTPKRGGAFVQANSTPSRAFLLDPTAQGSATLNEKPQIYERLLRPRACYYEDTVMLPALAKSWERSGDGLTWTFKVRDGVRWHDKPPVNGRPFTSADIAWTIEHQKQGGNLDTNRLVQLMEAPDGGLSLCAGGYKVRRLQPFDMFPQTAHLETLVELAR